MQIAGDLIVGVVVILVSFKLFVKFGGWIEKRSRKAIEELEKGAKGG